MVFCRQSLGIYLFLYAFASCITLCASYSNYFVKIASIARSNKIHYKECWLLLVSSVDTAHAGINACRNANNPPL